MVQRVVLRFEMRVSDFVVLDTLALIDMVQCGIKYLLYRSSF